MIDSGLTFDSQVLCAFHTGFAVFGRLVWYIIYLPINGLSINTIPLAGLTTHDPPYGGRFVRNGYSTEKGSDVEVNVVKTNL